MKSDNTSEKDFDSMQAVMPLEDDEIVSVSGGAALNGYTGSFDVCIAKGDLMNDLWSSMSLVGDYGKEVQKLVNAYVKSHDMQEYSASKARYIAKQLIEVVAVDSFIKVNSVIISS
ncbi:MAG: hypothetical protein LUC98_04620 [Lachnospiraceae bacterium]|nr:hypothetical protein [Lachnospiraceae bacterium]